MTSKQSVISNFSLKDLELCLSRTGEQGSVTKLVDLSAYGRKFGEVVIEAFLQTFDAENQLKIALDVTKRTGYICQKGVVYDHVVGEFHFVDDVFWRSCIDEIKAGSLEPFLQHLRGREAA